MFLEANSRKREQNKCQYHIHKPFHGKSIQDHGTKLIGKVRAEARNQRLIRRQKHKQIVDSSGSIRRKEHGNKKYRNNNDQHEVGAFHLDRQEKGKADHGDQNQINHTQIDKRTLQERKRIGNGRAVDLQRKIPIKSRNDKGISISITRDSRETLDPVI